MATTVIYNNITLHNVLTEQWEQETIYDESGTDQIGEKFMLRFRGVLHAQRVPVQGSPTYVSDGGLNNVFDLLQNVHRSLREPRGVLRIEIDGAVVLEIVPAFKRDADANTDINNGASCPGTRCKDCL